MLAIIAMTFLTLGCLRLLSSVIAYFITEPIIALIISLRLLLREESDKQGGLLYAF